MDKYADFQQTLQATLEIRDALENLAAKYTPGPVPEYLRIQLEEKHREVTSLQSRFKSTPDNLPVRPFVFVGRDAEKNKCLDALSPERCGWGVIIYGEGGIGKTTLALEVAHIARDRRTFSAYVFASAQLLSFSIEGTRRTNLAVTSSDAFVREFARILNLEKIYQAGNALERQRALLDALRGQHALFVLDNLEVLSPEERAHIAEFLNWLPYGNKAILTTRYCTFDSALPLGLDRLTELEAQQLLIEEGEEELAGDKSCRELYEITNGNPLILKYALGIVKKSSLSEAIARIKDAKLSDDLYNFLFRDAVNRLSDLDRMVLSTCAGFISPINAVTLAEILVVSYSDVSLALGRLVSHLLLSNLRDGNYSMPAFVRTYMRASSVDVPQVVSEKTTESVWYPSAYREGLNYWVNFAIEHQDEPDLLRDKWMNLKVAVNGLWELTELPDKLYDRVAAQMLISLFSALDNFLRTSEYWDELLQLSEWAYYAKKSLQMEGVSFLAYEIALTYCQRGEVDKAEDWGKEFINMVVQDEKPVDRALAKRLRGLIAQQRKDYVEAEQFYKSAYSIFSELGDKYYQAVVLNDLGEINYVIEKYDDAQEFCDRAIKLAEELSDGYLRVRCFGTFGNLFLRLGDLKQAYSYFVEMQSLASSIGQQELLACAYEGMAYVLYKQHNFDEARNKANVALELYKKLRNRNLDLINDLVKRLDDHLLSVVSFNYTTLTVYIFPPASDGNSHQYSAKAIIDDKITLEGAIYFEKDDIKPSSPTRSIDDYGVKLFRSLFSGDLCCVYDIAKTRAAINSGKRLRVQICISKKAQELHNLIWEFLCCCREGLPLPIARNQELTFSRLFELEYGSPSPVLQGPLRMLCVIANPEDHDGKALSLNVDEEVRNLQEAVRPLQERGMQVTLLTGRSELSKDLQHELLSQGFVIKKRKSSIDSIVSLLEGKHYHFLHFVGHGRFSIRNNKALLSLETEDGYLAETADDTIIERLRDLDLESLPKLIFLSTCQSANRQNVTAMQDRQLFTGLAYKLVQLGIPAVVAMQDDISIVSSHIFAQEFYSTLAVDGIIDKAMNLARSHLDANDWYVPVLLTRFQDGYLFAESAFSASWQ